MSRSAKETNASIFARLTSYAADHEITIPNGDRWIHLEEEDFDSLVNSRKVKHFPIARRQAAALLSTELGDVLVVSGFEAESIISTPHIREIDVSPGMAVAAIADLDVAPSASPLSVLNIVAAGERGDGNYSGHSIREVLDLFPRLRILEIDSDVEGTQNFLANLLIVCAAEAAEGNGWINTRLAEELVQLAEQRIAGFPYEFLVMATLDLDPKNLFLALYRCLEATYAFTRASELTVKLGVNDRSWIDVARALGESLSWYPRHDQSLSAILALAAVKQDDLVSLAAALGKDPSGDDVATRVAVGIREIRNSLVHYGPTSRPATVPDEGWNDLCIPLAKVVGSVFAHTYGGVGPTPLIDDSDSADAFPAVPSSPSRRSRIYRGIKLLRGRLLGRR